MTEPTPDNGGQLGGGRLVGLYQQRPAGADEPPEGLKVTGIPVTRGPWYMLCPVWWCRKDWSDGQAWVDANGPPCRHISVFMRARADGSYLQFMRVSWFPSLRAARLALGQWVLSLFRSRRL